MKIFQEKLRKAKKNKKISLDDDKLFLSAKRGREVSKRLVLKKYSGLVESLAKRFCSLFPQVRISTLIAEGNSGLMESVKRYDKARGAKFSTYAWFWIVKNMRDIIKRETRVIDLSQGYTKKTKKIIKIIAETEKKGQEISYKKIAKKIGIDADAVRDALILRSEVCNLLSLDRPVDKENDSRKLSDFIEEKNVNDASNDNEIRSDKGLFLTFLDKLSPIEKKVIRMRFGMNNSKRESLKQISEKLGISPGKIRDIESVSIMKIKNFVADSEK